MEIPNTLNEGIPLPFYSENFLETDFDNVSLPRQNFCEYFLYALRSRIIHDPIFANYVQENPVDVIYHVKRFKKYNQVYIGMQGIVNENQIIKEVGENFSPLKGPQFSFYSEEWFEEIVDNYLTKNFNYCVLLSSSYSLTNDQDNMEIPLWWYRKLIPVLPYSGLIAEIIDKKYDIKIEDQKVYINMITDSSGNSGVTTIPKDTRILEDVLEGGTPALKYRYMSDYGDYNTYSADFSRILEHIRKTIMNMFISGAMILLDNDPIIANWNLIPYILIDSDFNIITIPNLYIPNWKDYRLIAYDGAFETLLRQSLYRINSWNYGLIFLDYHQSNLVLYRLSQKMFELDLDQNPIVYGSVVILPVITYQRAAEFADLIDKVIANDNSIVQIKFVPDDDSTRIGKYYDLEKKSSIVVEIIPD